MPGSKRTIAILTGGGDVPGLNPAIRAITIRALREGCRVVGIRRGWAGLVDYDRAKDADNSESVQELSEAIVNRAGRTGGTFLHTSRTRPSHLPRGRVPPHLTGYEQPINDITKDVLGNLEHIGVDVLIPIGGDDTLSYGKRLHDEGVNVVAIPKTMDNDVYGTDYCIGFSTCVTRTIELTHRLRTSAGSHERFLVIEVFGRYAGFTALLPAMAGAADRCLIPEYAADVEQLTELMTYDHNRNPSRYSVALVSEGAHLESHEGMSFESDETDMFGHKKLGGIGDKIAAALKEFSPRYNKGRRIDVVNQRLGYLVRSGDPDALDSIVPMAFGNLALDLILKKQYGRLVSIHRGFYDSVPITSVTSEKKVVDVKKYYNTKRLRPIYEFDGAPLFIMTSD
jgi:ATP-dependent phosphofructokinase / diphosphate-dependent phosphofructokinase